MQVKRTEQLFNSCSEEQLLKEIAPGKNRSIYIIGHMIAYHDAMNEILGTGKRSYSQLDAAFMHNPDRTGFDMPSVAELKQYWNDVHEQLSNAFEAMHQDDWFKRHNNMTDEDFAKEPARNKLSVLLNRTNHVAYHLGQLRLLK